MRKTILVCILFVSTLPLCAHEQNRLSRLYHQVTRYVAAQQRLEWVLSVKYQINRALPNNVWQYNNFIPAQPQPDPLPSQSFLFKMHLRRWQIFLSKHPLLHDFTLKIPFPQDALSMSPLQADFLTQFLQNGITVGTADARYVPLKAEEFQHYVVRLTLQPGTQEKPFYLTINCYTKEVLLSLQPTVPALPLKPVVPLYKSIFH